MFSAQSTVKDFKHAFEIVKPKYLVVDVELVERLREALGDSGTKVVVFGDEISEYPLLPRVSPSFRSTHSNIEDVRITISHVSLLPLRDSKSCKRKAYSRD